MALFQAGLIQELQPLSLSITFGAWRQVAASKPRLQQALKRCASCKMPTHKQAHLLSPTHKPEPRKQKSLFITTLKKTSDLTCERIRCP